MILSFSRLDLNSIDARPRRVGRERSILSSGIKTDGDVDDIDKKRNLLGASFIKNSDPI